MTAFTSLWLLSTIVNVVYVACLVGLALCCYIGCHILWWDRQRARRAPSILRHPSASNVTVIRPPFDWAQDEASA